MQNYITKPQEVEMIKPAPCNPALTHKRPFTISFTKDKNKSIEEDERATEVGKVYTDSSVQEGKVGAAAILIRGGNQPANFNTTWAQAHDTWSMRLN